MENQNGELERGRSSKRGPVLIICGVVLLALIGVAAWYVVASAKITNFNECRDAGGKIIDGSPDQCKIYGKAFSDTEQDKTTPPEQSDKTQGQQYVGLTIEAANQKAEREGTPHRVVKRDGVSLPMTMDLVGGRLNFTVADGIVTAVEVESVEIKSSKPAN